MKQSTSIFPYWNLSLCLLLAGCLWLHWNNESLNFEIDRLAVEAWTVRTGDHLDVSRERQLHPHIQEWDVNIPHDGSYEIALQYDNLATDSLFQRNHCSALKRGKHVVRLEREQLPESQRLQVWVDGAEVLSLSMQADWQRTMFRSSIGNETYKLRSNRMLENQVLVLEEFRFFELRESGDEENQTGVLLFVAPAQKSSSP
jgi:hypothetical protein